MAPDAKEEKNNDEPHRFILRPCLYLNCAFSSHIIFPLSKSTGSLGTVAPNEFFGIRFILDLFLTGCCFVDDDDDDVAAVHDENVSHSE